MNAPALLPMTGKSGIAATAAKPRICFVVSSPMTAKAFLPSHIAALSSQYEVHLVLNRQTEAAEHGDSGAAKLHHALIERSISPLADLIGVWNLVRIFRAGAYGAVHSISPKAGLLTAIAGCIARVPVRIHSYTGQVWVTRRGVMRWMLKSLDALIARLDTHVLADSASQLEFLRGRGVLERDQGRVLGRGSICGVDLNRFQADPAERARTRSALGIPTEAIVFVFVGRLTRDKGVLDLARAFDEVAATREDLFLLCVGPDEENLSAEIRTACGSASSRLRLVGFTSQPERFLAASDIACLPSYREGFGAVAIEAAAAGVPTIGSRIYGIADAIDDGHTGVLFERGNVSELAAAMRELATDRALREKLGNSARERAIRDFSAESVSRAVVAFYNSLVPVPGAAP